jgi:Cu2+-exporting ATPase
VPACEHCLLEISGAAALRETVDGREAFFCCPGCRGIHALLRSEGLEGFYARREGWSPGPPADTALSAEAFADAVRTEGGEATVDLAVSGIRCASCGWLIERYLGGRPGVRSVRMNYATGRARISWDPCAAGIGDVLAAIRALGYTPYPESGNASEEALRREKSDLLLRFGTAAFLSMQIMLFSAGMYAGYFQGIDAGYSALFRWLSFALATPVVFYAGAPFFRGAARSARHGAFGMDALVFLGASSAYGYSAVSLIRGGEVYFDTATMILTLILLGRYIEAGARSRAAVAISRLVRLGPQSARKALPEGGTADVPVASLSPGDRVEIVPGERVPVDGIVSEGASEADESLLTGESAPVAKAPGAEVIAGSLNGTGRLLVTATRTGAATVLARIARAVEEAQARKAPIQRLADRVVRWFAPLVLAGAAATAAGWLRAGAPGPDALMAGISVLVVACPCALGLATPLAVLVGSTAAQRMGILVRGGDVMERAAAVRCVLLDKTGTVTEGRPRLTCAKGIGIADREALVLAASVEAGSEHALARAIADAVPARDRLAVSDFRAHPGEGVEGWIGGRRILLGRRELLDRMGVSVSGPAQDAYRDLLEKGGTTVLLARDDEAIGALTAEDALRPEAPGAVRALREAGLAVGMVTGDAAPSALRAAAAAGIGDVAAAVSPEGKREAVRKARRTNGFVLFAGDGVNDAPAIAEADVGVAMGRGTGVAIETSGATLMTEDLRLLPAFLALSAATLGVIRQNLFWAFSYNLVALPLAAAGRLHPIAAAGFMAGSSLIVVGNSLRLGALVRRGRGK